MCLLYSRHAVRLRGLGYQLVSSGRGEGPRGLEERRRVGLLTSTSEIVPAALPFSAPEGAPCKPYDQRWRIVEEPNKTIKVAHHGAEVDARAMY